jgi:geranylgeranyl diphosphate synthase type II
MPYMSATALVMTPEPNPPDLERLRGRIEARLAELVPGGAEPPQFLHQAIRYSLLGGGKRIRSLLTLITTEQLGGRAEQAMDPACAIEMLHTASLIVDDLPAMDDAAVRRGRPANHRVFGEDVAMLASIELLNRAFGVVSRAPGLSPAARIELTATLSRAVGSDGLIGGQFVDLRSTWRSLEAKELLDMYGRKTGALFAAAAEAGARVAGAGDVAVNAVREFALRVGLSFQILDDLWDRFGTREATGKDVGQDADKATYVSRVGPDQARDEALQLLDTAIAALDPLGPAADGLSGFARKLVGRVVEDLMTRQRGGPRKTPLPAGPCPC